MKIVTVESNDRRQRRDKELSLSPLDVKNLFFVLPEDASQHLRWKLAPNGKVKVGDVAGTIGRGGYRRIQVMGRLHRAHRLAWAWHHGEWPDGDIDHIDGDRANNRIGNLRVVRHQENLKNKQMPSNNSSGVVGVRWHQRDKIWCGHASINGKTVHLGNFKNLIDAVAARYRAERQLGYHENHGRSAG